MPYTIDGLKYPDTLKGVVQDSELTTVMIGSFKGIKPYQNMVRFYRSPPKPSRAYTEYLADDAPGYFQVPDRIRRHITDLMKNGGSDDPKSWQGITELTVSWIEQYFKKEVLPVFYTRRLFEIYHDKKARAFALKKIGDPKKVADKMGITDVDTLQEMLIAQPLGRKAEAAKLSAKLKADGAKAKNGKDAKVGKPPKSDASIRKLKLCGFEKAGEQKLRDAVGEMAEAYMAEDLVAARAAHKKVLNVEPKTSMAGKNSFDGLIKLLKQFKVITA
ncbi:hypothetical protein [Roseibium litorale]|uniref:Uncharacterized protein n=1 Tax=Roseibium litorale TaxID=2803841 RepID=A0ABR9CKC5_9HYPH|nr:hypothetical protein [Roseibium litorale]MBD8891278.1 hypothetical protein [Roseibium litorale]